MNSENLTAECRNESTMGLDEMSVKGALQEVNQKGQKVTIAMGQELAAIKPVVEAIVKNFNQGGRLIYMSVSTSGRLGVLDAAERVSVLGVELGMVRGFIVGSQRAIAVVVEGVEDSKELGHQDLADLKLSANDIIIEAAASGRAPYVIGDLEYATTVGAAIATVICDKNAEISKYAQVPIEVNAGPGFLTGSTCLRPGTVQKLILNMLSTISTIGVGKVCNNLVVDVKPTSEKLAERLKQIIMEVAGCSYEVAELKFVEVGENVKLAIVMILTDNTKGEATQKLIDENQFIKDTLN